LPAHLAGVELENTVDAALRTAADRGCELASCAWSPSGWLLVFRRVPPQGGGGVSRVMVVNESGYPR
jgi:hypothetical protein